MMIDYNALWAWFISIGIPLLLVLGITNIELFEKNGWNNWINNQGLRSLGFRMHVTSITIIISKLFLNIIQTSLLAFVLMMLLAFFTIPLYLCNNQYECLFCGFFALSFSILWVLPTLPIIFTLT